MSKFLDEPLIQPPPAEEGETAASRQKRIEDHAAGGYKAAILVRQNVVQLVQDQLDISWSAHKMMEHLQTTYGGTVTTSLALKWEEYNTFTIIAGEPPTLICAKLEQLQKETEEICAAKGIDTAKKLLGVMTHLTLLRQMDVYPYSTLRDQLATGDITTPSLSGISAQMNQLSALQSTLLASRAQANAATTTPTSPSENQSSEETHSHQVLGSRALRQ
ncbi:hypothetical protein SeLEV6574_g01052 [Synchytrium endobioticum]|uniref:Uncharacterized protein n=2 Tax=Synchytrium endobioticum TaxID=286115 RepID=A0A507DEU5_9FUNG|nr:hypothetical protein SeLEV6574_g01052 [Synchytrium endobioticum]